MYRRISAPDGDIFSPTLFEVQHEPRDGGRKAPERDDKRQAVHKAPEKKSAVIFVMRLPRGN